MQEDLIDKQLAEFKAFEAGQAVADKVKPSPLYKALAGLKRVSMLPDTILSRIEVRMNNLMKTLPQRLFESLPGPVKKTLSEQFNAHLEKVMGRRVGHAVDELCTIPEGRALVEQSVAAGMTLDKFNGGNGAYGRMQGWYEGDEEGNPKLRTNMVLDVSQSHGGLINAMSHELRHFQQAKEKLTGHPFGEVISPLDNVWRNRMSEADAEATAVDIAYKLMQAGKPAAWWSATNENLEYRDMALAYEKAAKKDPSSVKDGRAKRAAFDGWFTGRSHVTNEKISEFYNGQGVLNYPPGDKILMRYEEQGGRISPLDPATLKKLGTLLPEEPNYLDLPGGKPVDSKFYREPNLNDGEMNILRQNYEAYAKLKEKPESPVKKIAPSPEPSPKPKAGTRGPG
ncbi:MAG: hypothetical protein GC185_00360 [Alphaproteobacteria bacterium]|nr:hypothetical protein [Alphaproteobacteria bacterium]